MKNSEEEDDEETRADKRVSFPRPKSSQVGQWEQARGTKMEKRLGPAETYSVLSTSGALMSGRGGAYSEVCWNKQDGRSVLGMGPIQQTGNSGGTKAKAWAGFLPGLKEKEFNGPKARIRRSPDVLKTRNGLKEGLKRQKDGAHISTYGAASLGGVSGPVLPGMQADPPNDLRKEKAGKRGFWGLKKFFKEARFGPSGDVSGSKEIRRLDEGGASPGVEGSSDLMVDPAWICARGPPLHAFEGSPGTGGTPSFESCWEKGMRVV